MHPEAPLAGEVFGESAPQISGSVATAMPLARAQMRRPRRAVRQGGRPTAGASVSGLTIGTEVLHPRWEVISSHPSEHRCGRGGGEDAEPDDEQSSAAETVAERGAEQGCPAGKRGVEQLNTRDRDSLPGGRRNTSPLREMVARRQAKTMSYVGRGSLIPRAEQVFGGST